MNNNNAARSKVINTKVAHGTDTKVEQAPYMARLRYISRVYFRRWKSFHQCGATLLSSCWAITAAHCYIDPEKTNDVVSLEAAKKTGRKDENQCRI